MRTGEAPRSRVSPENKMEELLRLLSRQAERYTGGASSSLPVETARELLESICFCLGLEENSRLPDDLPDRDLEDAFRERLGRIEEQVARGRALWMAVRSHLPPLESQSMRDTVESIGTFWDRYDYRLFAQRIPCDIDYQLALPVPERLRGVDYVNDYLLRLAVENDFLNRFPTDRAAAVLDRSCPDWRGLLVNLFEPVFTHALGLALLGREVRVLSLTRLDVEKIGHLVRELSRWEMASLLSGGTDRAAWELEWTDRGRKEYLRACALALVPRVEAARDHDGMEGIFLPAQ